MKATSKNADSIYWSLFECLTLEDEIKILSRKVAN